MPSIIFRIRKLIAFIVAVRAVFRLYKAARGDKNTIRR